MQSSDKLVVRASKISEILPTDVIFGPNKVNKTVPVTYQSKPIVLQSPFMRISGKPTKTRYPDIYQIDTLFDGDSKSKLDEFFGFFDMLESKLSDQVSNHIEWFSAKEITIKSFIRENEENKNFYIRWAIDYKIDFIDVEKNAFDPLDLSENDNIRLIFSISDMWINGNQCGLMVVVQKVMVKPYVETVETEYHFNSDSDIGTDGESEDNLISIMATEQKPNRTNKKLNKDSNKNQSNSNFALVVSISDSDSDNESGPYQSNDRLNNRLNRPNEKIGGKVVDDIKPIDSSNRPNDRTNGKNNNKLVDNNKSNNWQSMVPLRTINRSNPDNDVSLNKRLQKLNSPSDNFYGSSSKKSAATSNNRKMIDELKLHNQNSRLKKSLKPMLSEEDPFSGDDESNLE